MRVSFKPGIVVLLPEDQAEGESLATFGATAGGHVFHFVANADRGAALHDLGPRDEACRKPINITYAVDPRWRPISNLALTPFTCNGRDYASVEGFWQGLKYDDPAERDRIAQLHGGEAKEAGNASGTRSHILYDGVEVAVGSPEHWALMRKACSAKFATNDEAREALLSTGNRPLMHRVRRDSRTIPGVIMADIWMSIRATLAGKGSP